MRASPALRAALAVALGCGVVGVTGAADEFVVIAHPSVGAKVRRADLAAVFLKRALRWTGGGGLAVPVDQSGASPVRKAFSDSVLLQPVSQVLQYWQKQMFSASRITPPLVKGSDAEVVAFVAKTAGAVGYVAAGTPLPAEVKALEIVD